MTTEDARNILWNMHIYFKCKHSLGCKATLLLSSKNHPACFFPAAWLKTWGYLALSSELISGCPEPGSRLGGQGDHRWTLFAITTWKRDWLCGSRLPDHFALPAAV